MIQQNITIFLGVDYTILGVKLSCNWGDFDVLK